MPRFNIALRPKDPEISKQIVAATQPLAAHADDYCLGEHVDHVTLTHFDIDNENTAKEIFAKLGEQPAITITLAKLSQTPEGDYVWVALDVMRSDDLVELQKNVCDRLISLGVDPVNKPANYLRPHFTYIRGHEKFLGLDNPPFLRPGTQVECRVVLGRSTQLGAMLQQIAP